MIVSDNDDLPASGASGSRPPAFRIGDHLALDILNSVAAPQGATIEWLGSGSDLLEWLVGANALDAATASKLAAMWTTVEVDAVSAEAVALREWFRAVVARRKREGATAVATAETARLNAILARDASYAQIVGAAEGGWRIVATHPWTEPGQLLVPIALAMADLFSNADWDLVRRCENPPCTIWFYDRTKGHRRRWCSQALCGNRAKVAAFRERQRQG